MRLFAFMSCSVLVCTSTSSRLWTCIRSICLTFRRRNDVSICLMPSSRPLVQTLVAMKSFSRRPRSATRSPATDSALPYIGEESISLPPALENAATTSRNGARAAASLPASNTCQVPRPMAGRSSPVEGIFLVMIFWDCPKEKPLASAAAKPSTTRLVILATRFLLLAAQPEADGQPCARDGDCGVGEAGEAPAGAAQQAEQPARGRVAA